jgi:hypothetical protein
MSFCVASTEADDVCVGGGSDDDDVEVTDVKKETADDVEKLKRLRLGEAGCCCGVTACHSLSMR